MFGFRNKKFLSEVCSIISDLGNIPLKDAQDFVEKNRDWVLRSKSRSDNEPFTAVMDLASQTMERVDAIYQTEMLEELQNIPKFFFLISVKIAHMTQDIPGNSAFNKYFVAILEYPVDPKNPDFTYKDLVQDLIDEDKKN